MGTSDKVLCQAVLDCVRTSGCLGWPGPDSGTTEACYCGQGVSGGDCLSGKANGPCMSQFEDAAEVSSPTNAASDVSERIVDQSYALGAASYLLQYCDLCYCADSCLGLSAQCPPGASGSGGTSGTGTGGTVQAGTGGTTPVGSGGATGTGGAAGTGGSAGVTYLECAMCEAANCRSILTQDIPPCDQVQGNADAGPAQGQSLATLCQNVVDCIRTNHCDVDGNTMPCYCGTASAGSCLGTGANGPCKAQFEAAAQTTDAVEISADFPYDPTGNASSANALGYATALIGCDAYSSCTDLCVNGDPPGYGAGGTGGDAGTGSGGSGGSGGSSGGSGGSGGVTVSSGGTTGSGGVSAATGGHTGTGGTTVSAPCADLNQNSTSDCAETAVTNSDFASSGAFWNVEYGMQASWLPGPGADAAGNAASGGLAVGNPVVADLDGTTMGGVRQCIPVSGTSYLAMADLYIPAGQGAGAAGVVLDFFPSGDCSGTPSGILMTPLLTDPGHWELAQVTASVPSGAMSLAVRLVVQKSFRTSAFQAQFDNILVKSQ